MIYCFVKNVCFCFKIYLYKCHPYKTYTEIKYGHIMPIQNELQSFYNLKNDAHNKNYGNEYAKTSDANRKQ